MATTAKPLPASPARAASTSGVQRQEVGLEGDFVDDGDDVGNFLRGLLDAPHGVLGICDDLGRLRGRLVGAHGKAAGVLGFAWFASVTMAVIRSSAAAVSCREIRLMLRPPGQFVGTGRHFMAAAFDGVNHGRDFRSVPPAGAGSG